MRVLVVEDEVKLAALIRKALREQGMLADVAVKGEDALWMAGASPYDVIVLDVNLPGIDGFETCRRLRAGGVRTPILMLTARDAVDDRVTGLDTGADDYLVKPFDFTELFARVRALARRGPIEREPVLRAGDLSLDVAARRVMRGDVEVPLSAKELQLLEVFMRNPGRVLSRYELLEGAWDMGVREPLDRRRRVRRLPARQDRPPLRRADDRDRPRGGLPAPRRPGGRPVSAGERRRPARGRPRGHGHDARSRAADPA